MSVGFSRNGGIIQLVARPLQWCVHTIGSILCQILLIPQLVVPHDELDLRADAVGPVNGSHLLAHRGRGFLKFQGNFCFLLPSQE